MTKIEAVIQRLSELKYGDRQSLIGHLEEMFEYDVEEGDDEWGSHARACAAAGALIAYLEEEDAKDEGVPR
jgi:hypothetical protein